MLEKTNSRLDDREELINDLEDRITENTQSKEKKNLKWNENILMDLNDNIKPINIPFIGVPEREDRQQGQKCIQSNYSWKIPKCKEGNRYPGTGSTEDPNNMNPNKSIPRHTIIKVGSSCRGAVVNESD